MFFIVTGLALVLSIFFTWLGLRIQRHFSDGIPAIILAPIYLIEFAVFTVLINMIGMLSGGLLISLGVFIALPPFSVLGLQIAQNMGTFLTDSIFASSMVTKAPHGYGKAKTLLVRGDIEGAIREYKAYYEHDPSDPTPLLQAASLMVRAKRVEEAIKIYRDVIHQFRGDTEIWSKASFSLAQILELHVQDPGAAAVLYHKILQDAPGTLAAQWTLKRQTEDKEEITYLEG